MWSVKTGLVALAIALAAIGHAAAQDWLVEEPEFLPVDEAFILSAELDGDGLIEQVNLIIATGQNNGAMNRTVTQIAQHYLTPAVTQAARLDEALLNRIEAGIRCFDPCLSCSTHAAGSMPLQVRLFSSTGDLLEERARP